MNINNLFRMIGNNKKIATIIFVVITAVLLWVKILPEQTMDIRLRTFIYNLILFALALPALYFVAKSLFGIFAGYFTAIFYYLLALFPFWLIIGNKANDIVYTESFINPLALAIFPAIFIASLALSCLYYRYRYNRFFPQLFDPQNTKKTKMLGALALLFILALTQCSVRFGNYTPWGEERMPINDFTVVTGTEFYGINYSSCDAPAHFNPAALFLGNKYDQAHKTGVINDRPTASYLYSQICYFMHPYIAGRLILFLFYFAIVVSAFLLCKQIIKLSLLKSLAVAIVLMSTYPLLVNATIVNMYIHIYSIFPVLAFCFYKAEIFNPHAKKIDILLYICLVTVLTIGYFPYMYILYHLIMFCAMGVYLYFKNKLSLKNYLSRKNLSSIAFLLFMPLACKKLWMFALSYYGVLGSEENRGVATHYLANIAKVPAAAYHNMDVVYTNALRLITNYATGEYWICLGVLGMVFFLLLPWLITTRVAISQYAIVISIFVICLASSLVAHFFPPERWHGDFVLHHFRSTGGYMGFILAQVLGVYFVMNKLNMLAQWAFNRSFKSITLESILMFLAMTVYALSFYRLAIVWLEYNDKYPMFNDYVRNLPIF